MTAGPDVDDLGQGMRAPGASENHDMRDREPLIGVPWSSLFTLRALRGLVVVALAVAILLWPKRSDQVVAVLVGAGLGVVALTTLIELYREPASRTFGRMLVLAGSIGLGFGLVLHPQDSLRTAAQLAGGGSAVTALADLVVAGLRRRLEAWTVSRDVAIALVGGVLVAFPEQAVTAVVVIAAAVVGLVGLVEILTPVAVPTTPVDPDDVAAVPLATVDPPATPGASSSSWQRAAILQWLANRPDLAEDRDTLLDKVYFEGELAPTRFARFLTLMAFASVIASVGVVVQSTAVVIGAMLIAPLMVPLMGMALSVPMGWPRRMRRSGGIAAAGIAVAIGTGALVGAVLPRTVDVYSNSEILARITPTMVDLAIAVAAGAAGAYALARRDVSDSLPGVAVAIALVPPLTVVGLCWQAGQWSAGNGALLLFLTNAIAIVLAGGATFVVVGAAPLDRVSESQQRVQTVVGGLFSLGVVIVLLLGLNGTELARSEIARAGIDQAMADWTEANPAFQVENVQLQPDGEIQIALLGPEEPPGLNDLAADLREAAGSDVPVDVAWVIRETRTISVGDG